MWDDQYHHHFVDLIRVVKTCAYHSDMPYCPVILEIKHPQLKQIFGGEYLLQVYNLNGESVFDKVLKCKCRFFFVRWSIHAYLVLNRWCGELEHLLWVLCFQAWWKRGRLGLVLRRVDKRPFDHLHKDQGHLQGQLVQAHGSLLEESFHRQWYSDQNP